MEDRLPVTVEADGRLAVDGGFQAVEPEPRHRRDMTPVLFDQRGSGPDPLYLMYRNLVMDEHDSLFANRGIRHDVTVLAPGRVGPEYVKTAGHYHSASPAGITYPEVYQVVAGRALYLLQRPDPTHDEVRVRAVVAEPGDVVVVPPDYGHVTVNIGDGYLVMANLVERTRPSRYEPYRALRGAAAYLINGHGPNLLLNPRYRVWTDVQQIAAAEWSGGREWPALPLYWQFVQRPETFMFLVNPEAFPRDGDR